MGKKKYRKAECSHCSKHDFIAARGLCRACYQRLQKRGTLEYAPKREKSYCRVEGCDRPVVSHGLCDSCRKRVVRYGTEEPLRPKDWGTRTKHPLYIYWADTKRRECLNIVSEWRNEFWMFAETVGLRPSKNHFLRAVDIDKPLGPENWQWIEGLAAAHRLEIGRKKGRNHDRNRAKVSMDERAELLEKANHCCQICGSKVSNGSCPTTGKKLKTLCVDHCHETGSLRGILCRTCNTGLGHFKDDIELLNSAVLYLQTAKE